MIRSGVWILFLSSVCLGSSIPDCHFRDGGSLSVNNDQVLGWKGSTPTDYHARAHVDGYVTRIYSDHTGHSHFEVQIGDDRRDTIEIVYAQDFGRLEGLRRGARVEACGDYITSDRPYHGYPASPDGAIVHWVHQSDDESSHPSGYVAIDGNLFGYRR